MSRPVLPRQTGGDGSGSTQDWRARWKRWAIEQLPATVPHAVRVEVRAAVERALARVPPTADEGEIRDLVMLVVDEARKRLNADAEREARHAQKAVLVAGARQLLVTALRKLSSRGALRMITRPGYSFQRLEYRLTRHLERHLTGEETWSEVQARVEAWVDARLAEPGVREAAEPQSLSLYELQRAADQVLCAMNLLAQDRVIEARGLLKEAVNARQFVTSFRRPRLLARLIIGLGFRASVACGLGRSVGRAVLRAYEWDLRRRLSPEGQ